MTDSTDIASIIRQLYTLVDQLEQAYPGRKFTLDGHLVGSIGEVLAREQYELELLPPISTTHDAKDSFGRLVQVKTTQVDRVALSSKPDYLIVLFMDRSGCSHEVYNGPGTGVWDVCGKMQKNGQRQVPFSKLKSLNDKVDGTQRIRDRRRQVLKRGDMNV